MIPSFLVFLIGLIIFGVGCYFISQNKYWVASLLLIIAFFVCMFSVSILYEEKKHDEQILLDNISNLNCHDLGDLIIKNRISGNSTSVMLDKFVSDGCKFDVASNIEGLK